MKRRSVLTAMIVGTAARLSAAVDRPAKPVIPPAKPLPWSTDAETARAFAIHREGAIADFATSVECAAIWYRRYPALVTAQALPEELHAAYVRLNGIEPFTWIEIDDEIMKPDFDAQLLEKMRNARGNAAPAGREA